MEFENIYKGILSGNQNEVLDGINTALDSGKDPGEILNTGMITAMGEVGRLFEEGEYFVPEMLISARAMQSGLESLKPHLVASGVEPKGKVVIGTVRADLHDIGKNLVAMMLEGAAFEIVDLGTDVSSDKFVEAVKESGANVVAMSALLTTTMPNMENTIAALIEGSRPARSGENSGWRCSPGPGLCGKDWRRWLCSRCKPGSGQCEGVDGRRIN